MNKNLFLIASLVVTLFASCGQSNSDKNSQTNVIESNDKIMKQFTKDNLYWIREPQQYSISDSLISDNQEWRPGFHSIYKVAPSLFELKDRLENHLCKKTDDLFNITSSIAIFDLTNFYFEGRKEGSRKA